MNNEKRRRALELMKKYYGGIVESESKIVPPELETVSISGTILNFNTDISRPLKNLILHLEPTQSGSGDPSPTNVRPIGGYNDVNVVRAGKNLFDPNSSGIEFVSVSNKITPSIRAKSMRISLRDGDTITLSNGTPSSGENILLIAFLDGNDTVLSRNVVASGETHLTRTAPSGTVSAIVSFRTWEQVTNAQLEFGSIATEYEPYQGTTYHISLSSAGTVYGGSLDVTTGVLTVNRAQIASYNGETLPGKWISDRDVYAAGASPTTGAQVVYELATPVTYQLAPTEVTTLLGDNTIWMDAEGMIDAEYWRIKQ